MQWWQTILAVFAGLGGTSGLILLIVKWAVGLITEKIQKDYDLKLKEKFKTYKAEIDKELEKHKSALGNKNYVTQRKFDVEFEMYQTLANSFYRLVKEAVTLIPTGYSLQPADKEIKKAVDEETYNDLSKAINESQDLLFRYAPFIRKDVYEGYRGVLNMCQQHKFAYANRWNVGDLRKQEEKERFSIDAYKRSDEISVQYEAVNQTIREYLQSLEILN